MNTANQKNKYPLREWIITRTYEAQHYIVTARTWQDALKFFNEKYPKKRATFAAMGNPSSQKEGYIEHKK